MQLTLRVLGVAGVVLFGALFAATFAPDSVERAGQAFIRYQVQKEVREKHGELAAAGLGKSLGRLKARHEAEAKRIEAAIRDNLAARIADEIAAMCRLDCRQRETLRQSIDAGLRIRQAETGAAIERLSALIQGKYLEVLDNLKRDLRIFLGSNAVLFLLVLVLSLFKPAAAVHLYLPAVLLVVSMVVSASLYLFNQNWLFTILYNDYVGFGYLAYVAVLFAFLCDVAFNKARVTTEILNWIFEAIGSAAKAVPCP